MFLLLYAHNLQIETLFFLGIYLTQNLAMALAHRIVLLTF